MFRAEEIFRRTKQFEGFRSHVYKDTIGVPTIGYGATMWYGKKVTMDHTPITEVLASRKLRGDIFQAVMDCQELYGREFAELLDVEQEILIHMAFQLGITKLRKFVNMNAAVLIHDIGKWEMEMKDSLWWRQTPRPATALFNALIEGEWTGVWVMDPRMEWRH
jgi:lysozyme